MVLFKTIDYYAQLFLITAGVLVNLFLFSVNHNGADFIFAAYFLLGGWQVCSVIAHFMVPAKFKVGLRKVYLALLLATAVVGALCMTNNDAILIFLFAIFFWSPILAIIYIVTSYRELNLVKLSLAGKSNNVADQNTNLPDQNSKVD